MVSRTKLRQFLIGFLILSGLDFLLTSHLLFSSDGAVYESNPLAGWFFSEFGWRGLAAFKLVSVLGVMSLALTIYRYRPRTGQHLLAFGCAILGLVVAYSSALAAYVAVREEPAAVSEARFAESLNRRLDRQLRATMDRVRFKRCLSEDVLSGRLVLHDAVIKLAAWDSRVGTDIERLAVDFVTFTIGTLDEPAARVARDQLESELWRWYGVSLPVTSSTVPDRAKTIWMAGELGKILRPQNPHSRGAFAVRRLEWLNPFQILVDLASWSANPVAPPR
jgi:hypothetical protein